MFIKIIIFSMLFFIETTKKIETINVSPNRYSNFMITKMSKSIQTLNLHAIISNNEYVQTCTSNKSKETHSLSSLIDRDLSQSDCIKLGTGLEKVCKDIVLAGNASLTNIKPKNSKGKKERDHLFYQADTKTVYYAELKSNLNLDTEKCRSTSLKCQQILGELQEEYPESTIKMFLLGVRYYERSQIPKIITQKYSDIDENVVGMNDYFTALGVPLQFEGEEDYKQFLNDLANQMFK